METVVFASFVSSFPRYNQTRLDTCISYWYLYKHAEKKKLSSMTCLKRNIHAYTSVFVHSPYLIPTVLLMPSNVFLVTSYCRNQYLQMTLMMEVHATIILDTFSHKKTTSISIKRRASYLTKTETQTT